LKIIPFSRFPNTQSTLVGWFHKGNKYGCFFAEKVGVNADEITNGEPGNKLIVVENTVQTVSNRAESNSDFNPTNMISKQETVQNEINDDETFFLESKFTTKIKLSSTFKDHDQVVKRLNSMGNLWKAANYEQYKDMTIEDLNNFAGRNKNKHHHKTEEFRLKSTSTSIKSDKVRKDLSLLKKLSNYHLNHKKTFLKSPPPTLAQSDSSYPDMPREHTQWIKYMSEPRNQVYII
jgi:ABC-type antimicrobial peptide transport system permease subunit